MLAEPSAGPARGTPEGGIESRVMTNEITVLIVDDHEVVREGLRLALSRTPTIRVVGEASDGGSAGDYGGLYRLAYRVIEFANCLEGSLIDKAAYCLCDLADLSAGLGAWDRQAVEVHINALKLLRFAGPEMSLAARQQVVDGLHQVTIKRVGDVDAARRTKAD